MTKVDIFSGFLGAGKTTLIKKLIEEAYCGEQLVLIENEFGEIGIDSGFLKDSGVKINEMNSGCICCSLVGDFGKALEKVIDDFAPDRILIEPSGVGKLSDVISAVENLHNDDIELNVFATVVDAKKVSMYMKNFGEFFNNQIEYANSIILSHTSELPQEKLDACINMIREKNVNASLVTTEWDKISGGQILETLERKNTIESQLHHMEEESCGHHEEHCCCGHQNERSHDHHHDNHGHDGDCCCTEHTHDHNNGGKYDCHRREGHHHDKHHHADEVFTSFGVETAHKFSKEEIEKALSALEDEDRYGQVIRAKGIVESLEGKWIHFDYVPGEADVRDGSPSSSGMLCVIGADIDEKKIKELFEL